MLFLFQFRSFHSQILRRTVRHSVCENVNFDSRMFKDQKTDFPEFEKDFKIILFNSTAIFSLLFIFNQLFDSYFSAS